jgi:hypothetical protein
MKNTSPLLVVLSMLITVSMACAEPRYPLLAEDSFDQGIEHWQPTDPKAWVWGKEEGATYNSLIVKKSDYQPPVRSPHNITLFKGLKVSSFELHVKARSTSKPYNHQSLCLFFNYQDPSSFYYVHFGKKSDDHANQIFIVKDAPRTKISEQTTAGTPWDQAWHDLKIIRDAESGTIEVFFDDMETPIMKATDKRFTSGQVGIGSFDDPGDYDDFKLYGIKAE